MSKESEKVLEILVNYANAQEAAAVDLKHRIAELVGVKEASTVKEETFTTLKFDSQKGDRLGEFEVAHKASNLPDKFSPAYGILRASNATIKERYHGPGYAYSYWLYGENKVYRQRLKKGAAKTVDASGTSKVEQLKTKFPKNLEDLLLFEEKGQFIEIRPRHYLGSDNFAKIAAIVRNQGGEYISAGKDSHFRLPKK